MSHRERGAGNFKAFLKLLVVGLAIFLAVKLMPPYIGNYQLQDDLDAIARMATYAQGKSVEDIKNDVVAKAKEDNVVITPDNVTIDKTQVGITIDVKYTVSISLPGKTLDLNFNPSAGNKLLTAK